MAENTLAFSRWYAFNWEVSLRQWSCFVQPSVNTAAAQNSQELELLKNSKAPKERNESQEPSNMCQPHTCFI